MKTDTLTQNVLQNLLRYDQETGVFTWLIAVNRNIKVGDLAGGKNANGYIRVCVRGRSYYAHRLAWFYMNGEWPKGEIDHRDGDSSNNRWKNLRELEHSLNLQNQRKASSNNQTGLLGVSPSRGRFRATIKLDGRAKFLGRFDSAEEAHAAYVKAKRDLHPGCTI